MEWLLADAFMLRALAAGSAVATMCGPLGCFVIWRRLAYYGDALSHVALSGVAMALLLNSDITISVFLVCSMAALGIFFLQRRYIIHTDALLGILAHGGLAIGLLVLALVQGVRFDLNALLFGDILVVSQEQIFILCAGAIVVIVLLSMLWQRLFALTVSPDIAEVESGDSRWLELVFLLLLASVVALSIKLVGVLLITAMLIIPAASARQVTRNPEMMAIASILFGLLAVAAGLWLSLNFDTPSGPSMVVVSVCGFLVSSTVGALRRR